MGFFKFYQDKSETPIFININENIVRNSSATKIKDFVLNYLFDRNELQVWNYLASTTKYFTDVYLSFLESIELQMMKDTKETVYLYFQNGVVEVQKDSHKLLDFMDCEGYVWEDQIIKREYKLTETDSNDFKEFIHRISGDETENVVSPNFR